jgi:hypothetical protein
MIWEGDYLRKKQTAPITQLTRVEGTPKEPGQWVLVSAECRDRFPIVLSCPKCGKLSTISSKIHLVTFSADGTLTLSPRFNCSNEKCKWKAKIKNSNYFED